MCLLPLYFYFKSSLRVKYWVITPLTGHMNRPVPDLGELSALACGCGLGVAVGCGRGWGCGWGWGWG